MKMNDEQFYAMVAMAAFSNPFSPERMGTDLKLAGLEKDQPDRLKRIQQQLASRLATLKDGDGDLRRMSASRRSTMLIVFLFDAFHRVADDFDDLIQRQQKAGDQLIDVPFARSILDLLISRGVSPEGARHFFAVFYQMRRAFHFINDLSGESECMKELRRRLWSNVFTHDIQWYERFLWDRMEDFSTLLLGATGTGKGAAAAAIGRAGFIPFDEKHNRFVESFTRGFVATNLSQFPGTLVESELFGHRKGAFTGAINDYDGILARCSPHGAIFLDEIGDVPREIQLKLLHVLQDRMYSPVGGHERRRFRGRVIAATNRPLEELRKRGDFRDDFFYRLSSDVITLPTLRQRLDESPGDLDLLLNRVLERMTGRQSPELAARIRRALDESPGPDYGWPGNVRELEQATRRIMLTNRYEGEQPAAPASAAGLAALFDRGEFKADDLLAAYCAHLYERLGTYEAVADRTGLDRRTVKKHILRNDARPAIPESAPL